MSAPTSTASTKSAPASVPLGRYSDASTVTSVHESCVSTFGPKCAIANENHDVTQGVSMGAFVGMSDATVLISSRVPVAAIIAVGYRLLTAPFCMGFAGIEAFCAFLAVATHKLCQPRQESLFERNAAG